MLRFKNQLYYRVKPYLHWRVRMGLRQAIAQWKRRQNAGVWPINESAGAPPPDWSGWPQGKRFAFVVTHDVEGIRGFEKAHALAEMESRHGIRSSFNFIPEGDYKVDSAYRRWFTSRGFEVGVHDLKHDGLLFSSKSDFFAKAAKINQYVREWGAKGFRAGFMLRNLDWLHDLEVDYDASTFDTDPFEPQSDGAGTIFPFWIPARAGASPGETTRPGYIELPYTLPQDSTLFLVLQEKTPDIWLRKLDWIAEHGGMALVNIHPDYVQFEGDPASPRTFPVAHYHALLHYLKERYAGQYWHATAQEVSAHVRPSLSVAATRRPKRVCMVTHSFYETDNRVMRYAEALADRGDAVDVFALRRSPELPSEEVSGRVRLVRVQGRHTSTRHSAVAYFFHLLRFLAISGWRLSREHARNAYDVIHVHNMPDFLVFAGMYARARGAKVILDIHDIVPELYRSKFGAGKPGRAFALLKWLERVSSKFSDHVIISNHLWLDTFAARTGCGRKCSVFINNVDTSTFRHGQRTRQDDHIIILFPGGLQWHQGLDIAIQAFSRIADRVPKAQFHIYGEGNMKPALVKMVGELGLEHKVKFFEPVRIKDVVRVMANADLGVVPKRADSFGNEAYSTKIMEFMSVGVPVVVSRTKIDQFYFDDSVVQFFESGNPDDMARAMLEVLASEALRIRLIANASRYAEANSWERRKSDYLGLVDQLEGVAAITPAANTAVSETPC